MAKKITTAGDVQKKSDVTFRLQCAVRAFPVPDAEHKFLDNRRFRFDYAFVEQKIAVEVEGGVWIQGRHTRGSGYVKDMEKYNLATVEGWRVLRFTPQQLKEEQTYNMLGKLLDRIDT